MSANGIINEKQYFTSERLLSFKNWNCDPEYIKSLENKFGNICLAPLDVPVIQHRDHQKFVDWFYNTCKPSYKQHSDVATKNVGYTKFRSIDVLPEGTDVSQRIWSKNIVNNFPALWPDIWEQMHEYLPFDDIQGFTIWNSTDNILPHRDPGAFTDFPAAFRILLDDSNPSPNLWVGECFPNDNPFEISSKKSVNNNLDTNCFVWNNLRTMHWSEKNSHNKILLIMLPWTNKINLKKYEQIIDRSISKYSQDVFLSSNSKYMWINKDT